MTGRRKPKPLPAQDLEIYDGFRRIGAIRTGNTGAWAVGRDGVKHGPFGTVAEARQALFQPVEERA